MDADLQHPPEILPKLAERLRTTCAEIVVASRHIRGGGVSEWSLMRRFISWTATLMATFILPGTLGKIRDPMSGFFLIRRGVLDHAALNPIGYKILLEVLAKGDYLHIEEVPFIFEERFHGGSKMGASTALKYLAHLFRISLETGEAVRLVKYGSVGFSGALVNYFVLRWLAEEAAWGVPASAAAGAALAILNNFVWNEAFTFWEARRTAPGLGARLRRLLAFVVFSSAGVLINLGLIFLLVGLGFSLGPSVLFGIGVAALWNFFLNSNVTWRAWWNRKVLSRTAQRFPGSDAALVGAGAEASPDRLQTVPCNLCQSTRFKILYTGNSHAHGPVTPQTFRCTSEEHGGFTNIVQCADCGLLYQNPHEDETTIEEQYAQVEDPTYERETEGRIRTFSRLLDRLERYVRPGQMVDVRCYTGVFLDLARARGWRVLGVEPSLWATRKGQEKGHIVISASLRNAGLSAESFDLVSLWDVLEHLHDPLGDLREMYRILKPGGVLGLSTMNAGSLFAKLAGAHWPWYMRMHFYYFTPGTITRMLRAAGFQVLAVERHKRIVSLRYLVEKGAALCGPLGTPARWLGQPFGRFYVTVDLGDIMNVYGVRPAEPEPARSREASRAN
jgi:putative flippase GtrA/SAM-dependent methyltransferase